MNLLKKIPLNFIGELHQIRLINFYVDRAEVEALLPEPLQVRDFNGKALISMVDVELKNMHLPLWPTPFRFAYHHIAFRLLIDDTAYTGTDAKGIFFLQAFTNKNWVVAGGKLFTNYRLGNASIKSQPGMLELKQGEHFLNYAIDPTETVPVDATLLQHVSTVDRAYAVDADDVRCVKIVRNRWPLRAIEAYHFETNFFKTAQLAGAFVVDDMIPYQWLPAKTVTPCESLSSEQTAA